MGKLLLLLSLFALQLWAKTPEKVYKVVVLEDWYPYYTVDMNGKPDGYGVELFEKIASNLGLKYEYVTVHSWKDAHKLLNEGEAQLMPNMGISEDRSKLYSFSQPTDVFEVSLFKYKKLENINSLKDIKEHSVGVVIKNVCTKLVNEEITNTKVTFQNFNRSLAALNTNEIDVLCYPKSPVERSIKELKLENIEPFGEPLKIIQRGMAVVKSEEHLLNLLDREILRVKGDGEYQKIYDKWFSDQKDIQIDFEQLLFILAIIAAVGAVIFYFIMQKKWLVSKTQLEEEIKRQTAGIENTKELLFSVINATEDHIFFKDKDLKYLGCNSSFEKFTGKTAEQIIGKTDFDLFDKEQADIFKKRDIQTLQSNTHQLNEQSVKYPNNKELKLQILKSPFKYDGKNTGVLGISRDITELTNLKEEQLKQQKLLFTQAKVSAMGEMLGNIAHQWRQPLSVITTYISGLMLDMEFKKELSRQKVTECADNVLDQCSYLSKTIDDFREFFMANTVHHKEHEIAQVIGKLRNLLKGSMEDSFIKCVVNIENNISVNVNENMLIQAFLNICNNAKDAMNQNVSDTNRRYLFIDAKKSKNNAVITFKDSGGGINEDIMEKIFDPYFTTKHQFVGTGIGLYMSHQIITKHLKGNIEVFNVEYEYEREVYKGAVFRITIPLSS
jgi:PAS domain S-box-containing protein